MSTFRSSVYVFRVTWVGVGVWVSYQSRHVSCLRLMFLDPGTYVGVTCLIRPRNGYTLVTCSNTRSSRERTTLLVGPQDGVPLVVCSSPGRHTREPCVFSNHRMGYLVVCILTYLALEGDVHLVEYRVGVTSSWSL